MKLDLPELNITLTVPAAASRYEINGKIHAYSRPEYSIDATGRLTATPNTNLYHIRKMLPEGVRASLASEELARQLALEKQGIDLRKQRAETQIFDDLFYRNGRYIWQVTETGLRVPKGWDAEKYETDRQGRKYWVRTVLEGDREVGEVLVPEGNGRVVPKTSDLLEVLDPVTGLPRVTSDGTNDKKYENHTTHFYFNADPAKDPVSGRHDVAVRRGSSWHRVDDRRCFDVLASYRRSNAGSFDGFRPVRGSFPNVEHKQTFS